MYSLPGALSFSVGKPDHIAISIIFIDLRISQGIGHCDNPTTRIISIGDSMPIRIDHLNQVSVCIVLKFGRVVHGIGRIGTRPQLPNYVRKKRIVRGRRIFCQLAVGKMGHPGAEVARFLGVTTSSVNRLAVSEETPGLRKYLKML